MSWQLSDTHEPHEVRRAYGEVLVDLIGEGYPVMVCDADLASSSGAGFIFESRPDHAVDFGICEQAMVSAAAAMSRVGLLPFVHSFAPFLSRRVADQAYVSAAFARQNIHIYASDPGYWSQYNGATHTTFEDIAIMRTMPGMSVVAPSDAVSFSWVLRWYAEHGGTIYNRCTRKPIPQLYADDSEFEFGRGMVVRKGGDVALIALGASVWDALQAAERLAGEGISASVVDLMFVKPLDEELVRWAYGSHAAVVCIENHSRYGGMGELVGAMMAREGARAGFGQVAVNDRFGQVGSAEYLKDVLGLSVDDVVRVSRETLRRS